MKHTEKFISPLVAQQFPKIYLEEGPMFVAFTKAYYEWLESANNVLYHSRRFPDYRDIDTTIEDFIVYFKEKYLKNIQFETSSNKRLFIKNAIPFYRSKGTERSVDLFFKLVYGVPAKVYYPGDDIFKLSDGEWIVPTYLEISTSALSLGFIGKEIIGVLSGAKAFVEDLVVKKVKDKYIHVLYISNIQGNFQFDEIIKPFDEDVNLEECPRTIGSVGKIDIIDGGSGFEVGQTVNFISANGAFAKAIVSGIEDIEGEVTFELVDGGFGYNSESQILISNNVLIINNITSNGYVNFETVSQELSRIDFDTSNGQFELNAPIFRYDSFGVVTGEGLIISKNQIANSGNLVITITSGDLTAGEDTIYNSGNTISANIVLISDITATGNVIGVSSNLTLIANTRSGSYIVGESIYQSNSSSTEWANAIIKSFDEIGNDIVIRVTNAQGEFISGELVTGRVSGITSNLSSYSTKIGVISVNNMFYSTNSTSIIGSISGTVGKLVSVSTGNGAIFTLGSNSTLQNVEVVEINTDLLDDYDAIDLDATSYGFPADPSGNATSNTIENLLSESNFTIGTLTTLLSINPGNNYNESPYVRVLEPQIYQYGYKDYAINYSSPTSSFRIGEIVKQANSIGGVEPNGAFGQILSTNSSTILLRRLLISNTFTTTKIVGSTSGAVATVDQVDIFDSDVAGFNAIISSNTSTLSGSVTTLEPIASGFGYQNQEIATFYLSDNISVEGTAKFTLNKQGIAEGFYNETGGFLSSNKYVYDGHYYQEYSYDVQVGLPFDKYSDMLKKVLHVAGTKAFGTYDFDIVANNETATADTGVSYLYANGPGTVSGNTTVKTLVGTSTTFLTTFSNGDFISIFDDSVSYEKKIIEIVDDTNLVLSGPLAFTNTTSNYAKVKIQ